jgi:membrane protein insertase Oxa1/YidC/SpoIIIJ
MWTKVWDEAREIFWLVSLVSVLSAAGVGVAIALVTTT